MRKKIEVLEHEAELGSDLCKHLLVTVMDLPFVGIAEHVSAYYYLSGIYPLERSSAAQKR